MTEEISVQDIVKILRKRWLFMMLLTLFITGSVACISFFILTPIYEAEAQLLVNQKNDDNPSLQHIDTDLQLINTYSVIIKSPAILSRVIEQLALQTTPERLMTQLAVVSANNSQVVTIQVEDKQASQAVVIAQTVAEVFQQEIPKLMYVDNITILSVTKEAMLVKPQKILNIAVAIVAGLMVAAMLVYFLETRNQTVRTEQEIEALLALPVIGIVSQIDKRWYKKGRSLSFKTKRKGH
ncbi:YveK family protein [Lysinibacillus piscis]|uniref:Capsular polysaccharide biosynthesis protein YwqC n=1 Tax=Lysinibacillus piscis TaxID=2518931 RepID=A0ABQ5NGB9_9BACI|nr:Wzz/FepE/Etk N-terminal domain-containing protein [Lysinibacillus sp. KH24]GLC87320.1 putative capsular polysaccharide biosynthesis protein YwqC [Lysinibacillus sp. KH24]